MKRTIGMHLRIFHAAQRTTRVVNMNFIRICCSIFLNSISNYDCFAVDYFD